MKQKNILALAAIFGALAVMIGAFGAHSLKGFLMANDRLATFETAVKYHFYHALALLLIGTLMFHIKHKALEWAGLFMAIGLLIFSGSLYTLCMTNIGILGAITPIGGVGFIIGWACLFWGVWKSKF